MLVVAVMCGCQDTSGWWENMQVIGPVEWSAEPAGVVKGFDAPECVVVGADGTAYVSNVDLSDGDPWTDDAAGFISRLAAGGTVEKRLWRNSNPAVILNAPKGMCIVDGQLYVADNRQIVRYPLAGDQRGEMIPVADSQRLNDVATDGRSVYVTDIGASRIVRLEGGKVVTVATLAGAGGITFAGGKLFATSATEGDLYEIDPSGESEPKAFGLAGELKSPGSVEVLPDGTFLVSALGGNRVYAVAPGRKTVTTLIELESPADVGIDRKSGLLYVPQFSGNVVAVYKLVATPKAPPAPTTRPVEPATRPAE